VANIKSEQFLSQIRSGQCGSLYLLDGPEKWLKEKATDELINKVFSDEERKLNLDRYDAKESAPSDIINAAQSFPFLSPKRIVVVQNAEKMTAKDSKLIAPILSNLPPSTILLFLYEGKAGVREEIPAQVSSYGSIVTFWAPFPNQIPSWIVQRAAASGKDLSYEAARMMAETNSDLQELSNEIDKLVLFVGKKMRIEVDDLLAHGLPDGSGDYKDLEDALWSRNLREGLSQGQKLSESGVRAESIFPVFERVFRQLLLADHTLREKQNRLDDFFTNSRIRGRIRQGQIERGLKSYKSHEIRRSFEKIVQAHMDLKTGHLSSELAVTLLLSGLLERPVGRT